ncbi:MAG: Ppx/GppA family phosphatase [Pseudomonadota bacterium]
MRRPPVNPPHKLSSHIASNPKADPREWDRSSEPDSSRTNAPQPSVNKTVQGEQTGNQAKAPETDGASPDQEPERTPRKKRRRRRRGRGHPRQLTHQDETSDQIGSTGSPDGAGSSPGQTAPPGQKPDASSDARAASNPAHPHKPGNAPSSNHARKHQAKFERGHEQTVRRDANGRQQPALPVYGALDLGTNNCRLLLARPSRRGFRVIDAFSRIIRLGEGFAHTGALSDKAMDRTVEALKVCAAKIDRHNVHKSRLVATEACRAASNGEAFLERVLDQTGLNIEILTTKMEATLAVSGCATLIDGRSDYVLVFDIGGGSSELIWLDLTKRAPQNTNKPLVDRQEAQQCMAAWTSIPVGVVTLAEKFGGWDVTPEVFEDMVDWVTGLLKPFEDKEQFRNRLNGRAAHLLGTSGTVTTVAGIQLGLPRYDRNKVDGTWMRVDDAHRVTYSLLNRSYEARIAEPCIGRDRADLVLAGCAILEALIRMWPCERLRVADRGLREGILATLMSEDRVYKSRRR